MTPFDHHIGRRLGPYNSFNPVSRVQIWQWCSAMGDRNPLYLDDAYRSRSEFNRVVAPPAMMQMWTMRDVNDCYAPGSSDAHPYQVFKDMEAQGYAGNVAVSYDIHFHRYLLEGERVHHHTTVVSISDEKTTALGKGFFVSEKVEYQVGNGECFAEAVITYFQYRPAAASAQAANTPAASQPATSATAQGWQPDFTDIDPSRLTVGDALPELVIPITHKLIVSGAIATQDFIPVHHNAEAARAAAMPDIFMNILTTNGLCARYLSDWAGPASRLTHMQFRLMVPNTPGDVMRLQGTIDEVQRDGRHVQVSVAFEGRNRLGTHVAGKATLQLPARDESHNHE